VAKEIKIFFRKLLLDSSFSIELDFDGIFSYANVLMFCLPDCYPKICRSIYIQL
jgi:hypothetical protein